MKVFFDTNILIDVFTNRDKECEFSIFCYRLVQRNLIKGYINAKQLSDIYYVVHKMLDKETAIECINVLSQQFEVVPYTKYDLINENNYSFNDIEDGSIDYCSKLYCCDYLLTRNKKHFNNAKSLVMIPKDFIELYKVFEKNS